MTILENNCMQSTASSAGYSTGGTLISAFAAYIMLNGHPLPLRLTLAWVFFLAVLGVTMAVPMKRQMINIEQLRFPSGIAAAETLRALHSHGEKGMRAAKALGIAGILAALDKFWPDGIPAREVISSPGSSPLSSDDLIDKVQHWFLRPDVDRAHGDVYLGRHLRRRRRDHRDARLHQHVDRRHALLGGFCACPAARTASSPAPASGCRRAMDAVARHLLHGHRRLCSVLLQWRSALRAFQGMGKMFSRASPQRG